jgi:hypothetical protein
VVCSIDDAAVAAQALGAMLSTSTTQTTGAQCGDAIYSLWASPRWWRGR